MAKETKIATLLIELQTKTEALEKGLETAKQKLQQIEEENQNVKNSNSQLEGSYLALSAVAVAGLMKISSAVQDGANKYNQYINSMNALQKTANATNNSMSDIKDTIEDVNEFKLIDDADLNKSMQNLLSYGFTVKQTSDLLKLMQDAAVGNKEPQYTFSEAVKVTTEGIRMENSVLSNASGIQKNIAKMHEEYAKSIGKTAESLTQAEKAQAVYNGFMEEAGRFTGSAAEIAEGYQGTQAQLNASSLELSRTFGETMIPVLQEVNNLKLSLVQGINSLIEGHKGATAGTLTFATALGTSALGIAALIKIIKTCKIAVDALNASGKALKITLAGLTIASVVAGVIAAQKVEEEQLAEAREKLAEVTDRYNKIQEKTLEYSTANIDIIQQEIQELEELQKRWNELEPGNSQLIDWMNIATDAAKYLNTEESIADQIKARKQYLEEANSMQEIKNAIDIESTEIQQKEAAQLKNTASQMQKYLDIVKQGNKSTNEYENAVQALAKAYPAAASAEGIIIDKAQDYINAEKLRAEQNWNTSQQTISNNISVIETFIEMTRQAENDAIAQQQLANAIGVSYASIIPTLTGVLNILQAMQGYSPKQVPGTYVNTPRISRASSGSNVYSNKALDNYKKQIEHKKAMDKISIEQEIKMYEKALKSYARTTDEKRELREKIYELNKELAQKEKDLIDKQTEDYEANMQKQRNAKGAAYDISEQTKDYNKIIQLHKKYLKEIMKDERLSLEERKEIYREELDVIRDYEQQKRDLRVEQIDNTVSQLTNAITKQLEEMQDKEKEIIDKNLKVIEEWKNARIDAINEEYDTRIEAINKELEALNKAEQQKTRDEEDSEYEKKKRRLEELVQYEHDATTKANYQKELDKLIAEYQKTLDARKLEDKKELLNEQKELLQEEQNNRVQAVEQEADKQKEIYENQLDELEKYYNEQQEKAQQTAEAMLLNVKDNQSKILSLLKNYGDAYQITGQTLGEKLAQGINEGVANKIQNVIKKIQDTIDGNIEKQIAKVTKGTYKYNATENKPKVSSINVTQINKIEQSLEMPSETYRKLNAVSQKLAEEFAGM